jgi:hypothetical protein
MAMRAPSPRAKKRKAPDITPEPHVWGRSKEDDERESADPRRAWARRGRTKHNKSGRNGTRVNWNLPDDTGYLPPEFERWASRNPAIAKAKASPNLYRPTLFTPKAEEGNADA